MVQERIPTQDYRVSFGGGGGGRAAGWRRSMSPGHISHTRQRSKFMDCFWIQLQRNLDPAERKPCTFGDSLYAINPPPSETESIARDMVLLRPSGLSWLILNRASPMRPKTRGLARTSVLPCFSGEGGPGGGRVICTVLYGRGGSAASFWRFQLLLYSKCHKVLTGTNIE